MCHALLLFPDLGVPKTLHAFTPGQTCLYSAHAPRLRGSLFQRSSTGRCCHQLHVIGLSQCMQDTYQMNLKYVPPGNISDIFLLLFSNSRTFLIHNVLNSFRVQPNGGIDYLMKIRYCFLSSFSLKKIFLLVQN